MTDTSIDDAFDLVGTFGRFQKFLIVAVSAVIVANGPGNMNVIFTHQEPEHYCFIHGCKLQY